MADIKETARITAPASKIYQLLTTIDGLQQWLSPEEGWKIEGSEERGGVLTFHFKEGYHKMKILKLDPDKEVVWECTEGHPEWMHTKVDFTLEAAGKENILYFGHNGWAAKTTFFDQCHTAWAQYVKAIKKVAEGQ